MSGRVLGRMALVVIAIVVAGVVVAAMLLPIAPVLPRVDPYQPWPWNAVLAIGGFIGILVGAGWLIRVTRGPEEKPAAWRYRDR